MAAPNIFLSYRRGTDGNAASRLYRLLSQEFGEERIFFDIDSIPIGVDFHDHLDQQVAQCGVFIAVIGPSWTEAIPRLHDPDDFVRIEIGAALGRQAVPVVPVLVDGAEMPAAADLPADLAGLPKRNGIAVVQQYFDLIVREKLVPALREAMGPEAAPRGSDPFGTRTGGGDPLPGGSDPFGTRSGAGDAPPGGSDPFGTRTGAGDALPGGSDPSAGNGAGIGAGDADGAGDGLGPDRADAPKASRRSALLIPFLAGAGLLAVAGATLYFNADKIWGQGLPAIPEAAENWLAAACRGDDILWRDRMPILAKQGQAIVPHILETLRDNPGPGAAACRRNLLEVFENVARAVRQNTGSPVVVKAPADLRLLFRSLFAGPPERTPAFDTLSRIAPEPVLDFALRIWPEIGSGDDARIEQWVRLVSYVGWALNDTGRLSAFKARLEKLKTGDATKDRAIDKTIESLTSS